MWQSCNYKNYSLPSGFHLLRFYCNENRALFLLSHHATYSQIRAISMFITPIDTLVEGYGIYDGTIAKNNQISRNYIIFSDFRKSRLIKSIIWFSISIMQFSLDLYLFKILTYSTSKHSASSGISRLFPPKVDMNSELITKGGVDRYRLYSNHPPYT